MATALLFPFLLAQSSSEVNITLLPLATGAAALDGSPYGFFYVPSTTQSKQWTISIEGGGWCVGVDSCLERSEMTIHDGHPGSLGSSTPLLGHPTGCSCYNTVPGGLADDCNCIYLPYLDGGSFSGNRAAPVPYKGKLLHYKGLRNLDATLDYAFKQLGLGDATEMVVTGGSAGGLSTFLHVDRVAARMRAGAPGCKRTTAAPVVGYFLDHSFYNPSTNAARGYPQTNYSEMMRVVVDDQNATAALLPACLEAFPAEPHLCFMSPHMVKFVESPLFLFNSKFDAWQMANDLQVPCLKTSSPTNHTPCSAAEQSAVLGYGVDFLAALTPVLSSAPKNGGFITSCICHGCNWTGLVLEGKSSIQHYADWHQGTLQGASVTVDPRPPNGGGDLGKGWAAPCTTFP